LTEIGKKSVAPLLLVFTTTALREDLHRSRYAELTKFCLKLLVCYAFFQSLVFGIGFLLGTFELNVAVVNEYLPIVGVVVSFLLSQDLASRVWFRNRPNEQRVQNIAHFEFLGSQVKQVAILSAVTIVAFHLCVEFAVTQLGSQTEAKTMFRLLIQTVVLGVVLGWISKTFFPAVVTRLRDKQFEV